MGALQQLLLESWLQRSRWVAVLLVTGLLLTGIGLVSMPTAFIPTKIKARSGAISACRKAPPERTSRVMEQIRAVIAREPLIRPEISRRLLLRPDGEDKGAFFQAPAQTERPGQEQ